MGRSCVTSAVENSNGGRVGRHQLFALEQVADLVVDRYGCRPA
jgi:hypothetical protein